MWISELVRTGLFLQQEGGTVLKRVSILLLLVLSLALATGVAGAQNIELTYWTHTDDNRTIIENRYIE